MERFEEEEDFEVVQREETFYTSREEDIFDEQDLEDFTSLTERKKVFKKNIDLAPVDHSKINYKKINKLIYEPKTTSGFGGVIQKREKLGIRVSGFNTKEYKPIESFSEITNNEPFLRSLRSNQFTQPTSIQAQTIPIALQGRDVLAISQTGSGKTLAFLVSSILHFFQQGRKSKKASPIVLILTPTRELAVQVFRVFLSLIRHLSRKIGVVLLVGGIDKHTQFKDLRKGCCDFLIGTPGRIIDLYKMKAFFLQETTMVVLDEVDRMFEMGFGKQVESLLGQIRLDRQSLYFSATLHPRSKRLVQDTMVDPVEVRTISPGNEENGNGNRSNINSRFNHHPILETVNRRINQRVVLVNSEEEKFRIFKETHLPFFVTLGSVLVFVKNRVKTEELSTRLCEIGFISSSLHGEKNVEEREEVLFAFRNGTVGILVSTDVASRGLDIPNVQTVVNYDIPKNLETYIHRIGRTGRHLTNKRNQRLQQQQQIKNQSLVITMNEIPKYQGKKKKKKKGGGGGFSKKLYDGNSVTFVDRFKEAYFAPNLVLSLESVGQDVGSELMKLAMKNPKFRNSRKQVLNSSNNSNEGNISRNLVVPPPPPPTQQQQQQRKQQHGNSRNGNMVSDMRYYSSERNDQGGVESEFVRLIRRQYQHSFVYSNTQFFDDTEEVEVIPPKSEEGMKF